jgi:hypothetical protein
MSVNIMRVTFCDRVTIVAVFTGVREHFVVVSVFPGVLGWPGHWAGRKTQDKHRGKFVISFFKQER